MRDTENLKAGKHKGCDTCGGGKVNLVIQGQREVLPFKSPQHLVCLLPQVVVGAGKKTARAVGSTTRRERSRPPHPSVAHKAQITDPPERVFRL